MPDHDETLEVTIAALLSSDDAVHGVSLEAGADNMGLASESSDHRYAVGDVLATGGMGAVLNAKDINIRRKVAMKVMLDRSRVAKAQVVRFIEEAQVTGQLEHPNIVPVHELGVASDGNPFYTMKMIKGVTLKKIIEDIRDGDQSVIAAYPLTKLLSIYLQACNGVAYAHSKGVVHRDLKPENIMVGEYGEVLVVDWGLAKIMEKGKTTETAESGSDELPAWVEEDIESIRTEDDAQKTIQGATMGTPAFMAPEQAKDASTVDHRADVYAMGGVLYNLLTLRPPVSGDSLVAVLMKVLQGEIAHPSVHSRESQSAINPKMASSEKVREAVVLRHLAGAAIPQSLSAVAMKALATIRDDRYQTVAELQADIQKYLDGFATGAEQAGFATQLRLLVMRHKMTFVSLAAALILLGTVITVSFVRLNHERAQTLLAKKQSDKNAQAAAESAATARQTLADLKATAPVFIAQARNRIFNQDFTQALEITGHALQLDPENAEVYCLRGHILQSLLRLREAEASYAKALLYRDNYDEARVNAALTKRLRLLHDRRDKAPDADTLLIAELRTELLNQSRMPESAYMITKLAKLGEDVTPEWVRIFEIFKEKIPANLIQNRDGTFSIDSIPRSTTDINGIQILKGMPIHSLFMYSNITDLSPLVGLDVKSIHLIQNNFTDISPLAGLPLDTLRVNRTKVSDFSPLKGMQLKLIDIGSETVTDISFMAGMPLKQVSVRDCRNLKDISPLAGLPLEILSIQSCKSLADISPIAKMPLRVFDARAATALTDIRVLEGMPIQEMDLSLNPQLDADDLKVLLTLPQLEKVRIPRGLKNIDFLKEIKTLTHIDDGELYWSVTASKFWEKYDKENAGKQ